MITSPVSTVQDKCIRSCVRGDGAQHTEMICLQAVNTANRLGTLHSDCKYESLSAQSDRPSDAMLCVQI